MTFRSSVLNCIVLYVNKEAPKDVRGCPVDKEGCIVLSLEGAPDHYIDLATKPGTRGEIPSHPRHMRFSRDGISPRDGAAQVSGCAIYRSSSNSSAGPPRSYDG